MKIYLVGGAVRDEILGRPVKERDWVVVGATPQDLLAQGYRQVGKDFPVFLHPKTNEEYALARTERKTGPGYKGFQFYAAPDVTLEDDLQRRDLTINAIAKDEAGNIIDPYGGVKDLQQRQLRHVSPAFSEDPVRILRVARFTARYHHLGFTLTAETLHLMQHMVASGEVNHLVAERVWQEWAKALLEDHPEIFFTVLRECRALEILFPELSHEFLTKQNKLIRATRLSTDPIIRFAAHVQEDITPLNKRYRVPTDFSELANLVGKYKTLTHHAMHLVTSDLLILLEQVDAFRREQRFKQFLMACAADYCAEAEDVIYPQAQRLENALHIANRIPVQPILDQGLTGIAIKQALHQQRLDAINAAIK